VLALLGVLHMRMKFVIPEELGGDYEPAVSACVPGTFAAVFLLTGAVDVIGSLEGHGGDAGGVVCLPSVVWLV